VSFAVCALVLGLIYRRYLGILGADRRRPAERQAYDALRESLAEGNLAARLYADRLTRFLDWIDGFFKDAGMSDRTLFPHAFGLRTPAPLWTPPSLDRCLFLALFYPILTIFVIWAVSGHVGVAEAALLLKPDIPGWQRGLVVVACVPSAFLMRQVRRTTGWSMSSYAIASGILLVAAAFAVSGAIAGVIAGTVSFILVSATSYVGSVAVAYAFSVALGSAITDTGALAISITGALLLAGCVSISSARIAFVKRGRQGVPFRIFRRDPGLLRSRRAIFYFGKLEDIGSAATVPGVAHSD
jgi:hypothetical protein